MFTGAVTFKRWND